VEPVEVALSEVFAPRPYDIVGEQAAALLRRLARFPFWRGSIPLVEALAPVYADASPRGLDAFLGEG
jgi:hypothetical protein